MLKAQTRRLVATFQGLQCNYLLGGEPRQTQSFEEKVPRMAVALPD